MLRNPGFEEGIEGHRCHVITPDPAAAQWMYVTERGEVNPPKGWEVWYVHDRRPPAHDPGNSDGWCEPEVRLAPHQERVLEGLYGVVLFTFFRIHDGGLFQQVSVAPGTRMRFTINAHAWTSNRDDPLSSEWVGSGGFYALAGTSEHDQVTFQVGIDPTGGTNPFADSVVWGSGAHIYNVYHQVPAVEAVAQSSTITVFTRGTFRWRLKHCDQYYEAATLTAVQEPPPVDPPPPPPPAGYGYPVVATGSKLHPHAISESGTYDLLQHVAGQGVVLPVFKVVVSQSKDFPAIRNLHNLMPDARIIGRVLTDGAFNPQGWGPGVDVAAYMAHFTQYANDYPEVTWWELFNEQDPPDAAGHVAMARWCEQAISIAEREGYKLALMSYSTGVPEAAEWRAIWEQTQFFQRAQAGGHILALHAYCRTSNAQQTADHLLRPMRDLYGPILIPNDSVVPFVFTEYSVDESAPGGGISDWSAERLLAEYEAVDEILSGVWYCLGASVYTFGALAHYNHDKLWRQMADLIIAKRARENALPPGEEPDPPDPPATGLPVEPYDKTYHVVEADIIPVRRIAIYTLCAQQQQTVGPAATDAVSWARELLDAGKTVTMVVWDRKAEDKPRWVAWAKDIDPRIVVRFMPELQAPPDPPPTPDPGVKACRQGDAPWGPIRLGASSYTMASAGCLVTAWATKVTEKHPDLTPLEVVKWLNLNGGFTGGGLLLMAKPCQMFVDMILKRYEKWREGQGADMALVREALKYGPTIIQVDFDPEDDDVDSHFVVALREVAGDMEILDPWTGKVTRLLQAYNRGGLAQSIFALADYRWTDPPPPPPPPPTARTLLGFNDHPGATGTAAEWMAANKLAGLVVRPIFLGGNGTRLDFRAAEDAGLRVIVNLRYSWSTDCGGSGTLPLPGTDPWVTFIQAASQTMMDSVGVWGWEIGNEYNNPREFPREGALTADRVLVTYNTLRDIVRDGTRMAPGALDPFNAQAGDPRDWLRAIWNGIDGAEFVTAHGYVRGPDASLVGSTAKFANAPLQWQYLNYPGCITALLATLPAQYKPLAVYITEFNHLWKTIEGDWGWVSDDRAARVTEAAYQAAQSAGFAGLALYRWAGDEWTVAGNGVVLGAAKALIGQ